MLSFLSFQVIQQDLGIFISASVFGWLPVRPFCIFCSSLSSRPSLDHNAEVTIPILRLESNFPLYHFLLFFLIQDSPAIKLPLKL